MRGKHARIIAQRLDSMYGHDGFLLETEAVGKLIRRTLDLASR